MATMAASFVGSDIWNAELYGTMSTASRMSAAIKDGRNLLKIRWSYMRLNHNLDTFLEKFFSAVDAAQRGISQVKEPATPAQLKQAIESLWDMHHSLVGLNELSKRKGLKKKPLTAGQVNELEAHTERVVDVIQWITELTNIEEVQALNTLFNGAMEEFERGETVTIP